MFRAILVTAVLGCMAFAVEDVGFTDKKDIKVSQDVLEKVEQDLYKTIEKLDRRVRIAEERERDLEKLLVRNTFTGMPSCACTYSRFVVNEVGEKIFQESYSNTARTCVEAVQVAYDACKTSLKTPLVSGQPAKLPFDKCFPFTGMEAENQPGCQKNWPAAVR
jgi:hypothetical protein